MEALIYIKLKREPFFRARSHMLRQGQLTPGEDGPHEIVRIKPHATTALAYFASIDLGSWGQAVNLQACARFGHSRNPRAGTSEFMSDLCIRRNRYM